VITVSSRDTMLSVLHSSPPSRLSQRQHSPRRPTASSMPRQRPIRSASEHRLPVPSPGWPGAWRAERGFAVGRILLDQRQGIPAGLGKFHAIASGREIRLHDGHDRGVIVDAQDTGNRRATVAARSPLAPQQ
jgi:hypothetical protein